METNQTEQKSRPSRLLWYGLGTLALGTLAFFGISLFKKSKNKNDEDPNQTDPSLDLKKTAAPASHSKPAASLPAAAASDAFPLALGSKGAKVTNLQNALIRTFGTGILGRYGADSYFGKELASALTSKGYSLPLKEEDYNKIIQPPQQKEALKPFDPPAIAKGIYDAILAKDYNSAITLLKSIGNTTNYFLVSEKFKTYYLGGVRQTLVNGILNAFSEKSQKENTQKVLAALGLKYDGQKWSA